MKGKHRVHTKEWSFESMLPLWPETPFLALQPCLVHFFFNFSEGLVGIRAAQLTGVRVEGFVEKEGWVWERGWSSG